MKLHEYLKAPGSLTVAQLGDAIGVRNPTQIRQWQHEYAGRKPGPEYCSAIERATGGAVMRWDLRPDDWHLIWPELQAFPDAPVALHLAGAKPVEA
jgi:DNA-binding transcriptional regulator YdaS (Cro superfamily)